MSTDLTMLTFAALLTLVLALPGTTRLSFTNKPRSQSCPPTSPC